ncbi:hypothetical protein [Streptomyces nojiriensis]|uniref:hypothetical protein n=1 Tax=Streptomyces nojiriensis TaxID=66374 RepID=UPI0035DAF959
MVLIGLDLLGGILTNATNSAKRRYHRQAPGARRARLLFVGAHVLHLAAVGLLVLGGDRGWTLGNTALLLSAAVVVNLFGLPVTAALAWFAPLFFLKLLVCHLVPEAPLERRRDV